MGIAPTHDYAKDALKKGKLYNSDVPKSDGAKYPESKKVILDLVPPKGYWRDLPLDIQKEYIGKLQLELINV